YTQTLSLHDALPIFDLSSSVITGTRSEVALAYGVGVQYPFTGNLSGAIDYVQYLSKKNYPTSAAGGLDIDVKAIGVGLTYTFRRSEEHTSELQSLRQ